MSYKPCSVMGCKDKRSSRHRFPDPAKDLNRYIKWLHILNNPKLEELPPTRVYQNFRVCGQHFTRNDIISNARMKQNTLPSQNLSTDANQKRALIVDTEISTKESIALKLEEYLEKINKPKELQLQTNISNRIAPTLNNTLDHNEDDNSYQKEDAFESNNQDKTLTHTATLRTNPTESEENLDRRRNERYRRKLRSDVTAKFFAAMERSFRQLPKPLQLSLKGELFALVLKYEKQALEQNSLVVREFTPRTYSNKFISK